MQEEDSESNEYILPNTWDALGLKETSVKSIKPGVTRVEQNNNVTTDYGYDDFGRIAYVDSKTAGRKHYRYDARDQLINIELANGVDIGYQYDEKGRQINKMVKQEDKIVQQVAWEFDAQDQLIAANSSNQQITYLYDKQGRVIQKRLSLADLATPLVTSYNYDKDGSMTSIILPDGIEILSNNDQIRYKAPDDIKANTIYSQSTHQAAGLNQTSYQLGQHIIMGHYYDDQGHFSGLSYRNMPKSGGNPLIRSAQAYDTIPLFSQQWQRTSDNIVEQVTELDYKAQPTEHNYLYDSQYHLVSSTYQPIDLDNTLSKEVTATTESDKTDQIQAQARYIYDNLGNRILEDEQTQIPKYYQYDDQGRLTTINTLGQTDTDSIINSKSISYNPAGQPTHYGDYQLSYSAGQLSQVKGKDGQLIAQYTYSDEGQRIKKTVYQKDDKQLPNPETNYYVYEDSQLQHELDGQGNIIRHYLYIGNTLTATMDYQKGKHGKLLTSEQSNISLWTRSKNWIGSLWGQDDAYPSVNYVITDYLGRPRQVRDGETNILKWHLTPTLFGGYVDTELQQQSDYQLNMRFPGQYEDSETGLSYNHWRYYDQDTGRYLSADPLGLGGGENLYAYVNATPTHFIDPPGLLLFAFDGTGNQDYDGASLSNVVKFRDAYQKNVNEPAFPSKLLTNQKKGFDEHINQNAFYISGAGTTDQYSGITAPLGDGGTGISMVSRVNQMVDYLHTYLKFVGDNYTGKNKPKTSININLDVIGFSRGAASARMFASKVQDLMSTENKTILVSRQVGGAGTQALEIPWIYNKAWLQSNCNVNFNFNFMGLWDTVPSYGGNRDDDVADMNRLGMSLSIPATFKKVVHAVAVNEHRAHFNGRSIFDNQGQATKFKNSSNRVERGFLGAHSDIGGGYREGDLSDVSLMWVIQEAKKAGIKFTKTVKKGGKNVEVSTIPDAYKTVTNPIVHDSVGVEKSGVNFMPGREFRWVGTDVKMGDGIQQFERFEHLRFNWEDSRQFQSKNAKGEVLNKFEDIKIWTSKYNNKGLTVCGQVKKCPQTKAIIDLKQKDLDGDPTILYKYMQIDGYIAWLKNNGYGLTDLKADVK